MFRRREHLCNERDFYLKVVSCAVRAHRIPVDVHVDDFNFNGHIADVAAALVNHPDTVEVTVVMAATEIWRLYHTCRSCESATATNQIH